MGEIKQELRQFVVDNFLFGLNDAQIADNDSLMEKGIIDSTGVLELIFFLETTYHIAVEEDDLVESNLGSIDGLARYVQGKCLALSSLETLAPSGSIPLGER